MPSSKRGLMAVAPSADRASRIAHSHGQRPRLSSMGAGERPPPPHTRSRGSSLDCPPPNPLHSLPRRIPRHPDSSKPTLRIRLQLQHHPTARNPAANGALVRIAILGLPLNALLPQPQPASTAEAMAASAVTVRSAVRQRDNWVRMPFLPRRLSPFEWLPGSFHGRVTCVSRGSSKTNDNTEGTAAVRVMLS